MTEVSCVHSQLDSRSRCRRCGVEFVEVWREVAAMRYGPLVVSFLFIGAFIWVFTRGLRTSDNMLGFFIMMAVLAYFMARVIRGVLDLFVSEVTYGGHVREIRRRSMWNLFSTRDAIVIVGNRRFSMGSEAVRQLEEGELVLFRYLRWTRTVMAICKPTRQ